MSENTMSGDVIQDQRLQEVTLKHQELRLREREVVVKEEELRLKRTDQKPWRNPLFLGLMAAAISLLGNAVSTAYQANSAQELASKKFQNDLVFAALNTDDPKVAAQRLAFLINLGYMEDPDYRIKYYIDNPERLPKGPWPGDKVPAGPLHEGKPPTFPDKP